MERRTMYIIGGLVGACILCSCIGLIVMVATGGLAALGLTGPAADVGESFMVALRDRDYNTAYRLCDPALQAELGSVEGLQLLVEAGSATPATWSFNSRQVSGNTATLSGNMTFESGQSGQVDLTLSSSGDSWLLTSFNLR